MTRIKLFLKEFEDGKETKISVIMEGELKLFERDRGDWVRAGYKWSGLYDLSSWELVCYTEKITPGKKTFFSRGSDRIECFFQFVKSPAGTIE
jgi:hypothetical protein